MSQSTMNRRQFLELTASAAAMLGLSGCAGIKITPFARPRLPRPIAPGAKLRLAQIGFGGQGHGDILQYEKKMSAEDPGVEVVALCDVDWTQGNVQDIFKRYPNAKRYRDYRQMLLEMDDQLDAVEISVPDHNHFLPAYMAMSMGKHVYVQKPLTQTIGEARELLQMARKHKVCTQMGNQGHARDDIRILKEWFMADLLGPVKEVHVWTNRPIWPQAKEIKGRPAPTPMPEGMAWDNWLGRAPERPYSNAYHTFKWRGFLDFGTGALGDMGCHSINGPYFALDLEAPLSATAETSGLTPECYPEWSIITYEFAARGKRPPVKIIWYDGGKRPERPAELEASRRYNASGQIFVCEKGKILSQAEETTSPRVIPESKMRELTPNLPKPSIPRIPGANHYLDWVRAIRANDPNASGTHFEYAVPLVEIVLLGNLALRVPGQKVLWDSKKMKVTSHPELNKYLYPTYRPGWKPKDLA